MGASSAERPMPDQVGVRPARVEDAEVTASIRVRGWQTAYRGQLPDELLDALSIDRDTVRFADHFGHLPVDRRTWVAELDGEVVGFASTGPSRDPDASNAGEVYAIYVRPDLYRRGIGARLLDHAVADLEDRGYPEAILWTLETNRAAQRFYERVGWRCDGTTKVDQLDEFELKEVRFRLPLAGGGVEPG